MSELPAPLALSMGDPAGIGPEIVAASWAGGRVGDPFFLIGDPALMAARAPGVPVDEIAAPEEAAAVWASAIPVLPVRLPAPASPARPDPANAPAVIAMIARGAALAREGRAAALVTCPINKAALYEGAGFAFPGHTEFLADLDGASGPVMMLAGPSLKVVPVTIHIPLARVPEALDTGLVVSTARITAEALRRDFGVAAPRLAIAGLNPHAGEGGAMGDEELRIIAPAIETLRAEGLQVTGPHPADTLFHAAARARYDVALTMYHDQGLIPIKALDFDEGVNVTLGLSFIRTSPDHGTAYDIAGRGVARPDSLVAALRLAGRMARARAGERAGAGGPA